MTELEKIQQHLQANQRNYIDVVDLITQRKLETKLYLDQIVEKYTSVEGFIKKLIADGIKSIMVKPRQRNGSSHIPLGSALNLAIAEKTEAPKTEIQHELFSQPVTQEVIPHYSQNNGYNPQNNGYNPQLNGGMQMPMVQQSQVLMLREELVRLKDKVIDAENEAKDFKKKYRKIRDARDELQSKVNLSEREKEFALRAAALDSKTFMDSEAGQLLITSGLSFAESVAAAKATQPTGALYGAAQNPNYSESKRALIMALEADGISDDICKLMYFTLFGITQKPEFTQELQTLFNKHEIK